MQRGKSISQVPQAIAVQTEEGKENVVQYFIDALFTMFICNKDVNLFLTRATLMRVANKEILFLTNQRFCARLDSLIIADGGSPEFAKAKTKWQSFFSSYLRIFYFPNSNKLDATQKREAFKIIKEIQDKLSLSKPDSKVMVLPPKPSLVDVPQELKQKYQATLDVIKRLIHTISSLDTKKDAEKIWVYREEMFHEMKKANSLAFILIEANPLEKNQLLLKISSHLESHGAFLQTQQQYPQAIVIFDELLELVMKTWLSEYGASTKMIEIFIRKIQSQALLFQESKVAISDAELAKNELIYEKLNFKNFMSPLFLFIFFNIQTNKKITSRLADMKKIITTIDPYNGLGETGRFVRKKDNHFLAEILDYVIEYVNTTKKCHADMFGFLMVLKQAFQKFCSPIVDPDLFENCDKQVQVQQSLFADQVTDLTKKIKDGLRGNLIERPSEVESLTKQIISLSMQIDAFNEWAVDAQIAFFSEQRRILSALQRDLDQARASHKEAKEALKKDKEQQKKQEKLRKITERRIAKKAEKNKKLVESAERVVDRAASFGKENERYATELTAMALPKLKSLTSFPQITQKLQELTQLKTTIKEKCDEFKKRQPVIITEIGQALKTLDSLTDEDEVIDKKKLGDSLTKQIENVNDAVDHMDRQANVLQDKIDVLIERVKKEEQNLQAKKTEDELEQKQASEFLKLFFKDTLGTVDDLIAIHCLFDLLAKKHPPTITPGKGIKLYIKGGMTLRFGLWAMDTDKSGLWLPAQLKDYDLGIEIDHFPSAKSIQNDLLEKKFVAKSINNTTYAGHIDSKQDFRFGGFTKLFDSTLVADLILMYRQNYVPNPLHYLAQGQMQLWQGKTCPTDVDPLTVTPFMPGFYVGLTLHEPFQASLRYLVTHSCMILNSPQDFNTNVIGFSTKYIQKGLDIVKVLNQREEKPKKSKKRAKSTHTTMTFKWYVPHEQGALTMDFLQQDTSPTLALPEIEAKYRERALELLESDNGNELYRWTAELVTREIALTDPIVIFFVRGFFQALIEYNHPEEKFTGPQKNSIVMKVIGNIQRYCEKFPDRCSIDTLCSRFDEETQGCIAAFKRQQTPKKSVLVSRGFYGDQSKAPKTTSRAKPKDHITVQLP